MVLDDRVHVRVGWHDVRAVHLLATPPGRLGRMHVVGVVHAARDAQVGVGYPGSVVVGPVGDALVAGVQHGLPRDAPVAPICTGPLAVFLVSVCRVIPATLDAGSSGKCSARVPAASR